MVDDRQRADGPGLQRVVAAFRQVAATAAGGTALGGGRFSLFHDGPFFAEMAACRRVRRRGERRYGGMHEPRFHTNEMSTERKKASGQARSKNSYEKSF